MSELHNKYPWLKVTTTIEDYVSPEYYERLLKDYVFSQKTDLELFADYLDTLSPTPLPLRALELGCGSGRVTRVFLRWIGGGEKNLRLVDLSRRMLSFCQSRFDHVPGLEYVHSDSIAFLSSDRNIYDLVFSLWSFSHSIHQILTRDGLENGSKYVRNTLLNFIRHNMVTGSRFFLIHFDSMSDEQQILMQQWRKVYSIYEDSGRQSPSKLLIDDTVHELARDNIISISELHLTGDDIVYSSVEEALEIFINFHMESFFNDSPLLPLVIEELETYFKSFTGADGMVRIKPGCFIYDFRKL